MAVAVERDEQNVRGARSRLERELAGERKGLSPPDRNGPYEG